MGWNGASCSATLDSFPKNSLCVREGVGTQAEVGLWAERSISLTRSKE